MWQNVLFLLLFLNNFPYDIDAKQCEIKEPENYVFTYKLLSQSSPGETKAFQFQRDKDGCVTKCDRKKDSTARCKDGYFCEYLFYASENGYCYQLPVDPHAGLTILDTEVSEVFSDAKDCPINSERYDLELIKQPKSPLGLIPFYKSLCFVNETYTRRPCKHHDDCNNRQMCQFPYNMKPNASDPYMMMMNATCDDYPRIENDWQVVLTDKIGLYVCDEMHRCPIGKCYPFANLTNFYYPPDVYISDGYNVSTDPSSKYSGICLTGYPFCLSHNDCAMNRYCERRKHFFSPPKRYERKFRKLPGGFCADDVLALAKLSKPPGYALAREYPIGMFECDENFRCPDPYTGEGVDSPPYGYCIKLLGNFGAFNFTSLTTNIVCDENGVVSEKNISMCLNGRFVILGNHYRDSIKDAKDVIECSNQHDCDARLVGALCITQPGGPKVCRRHPYNFGQYGDVTTEMKLTGRIWAAFWRMF